LFFGRIRRPLCGRRTGLSASIPRPPKKVPDTFFPRRPNGGPFGRRSGTQGTKFPQLYSAILSLPGKKRKDASDCRLNLTHRTACSNGAGAKPPKKRFWNIPACARRAAAGCRCFHCYPPKADRWILPQAKSNAKTRQGCRFLARARDRRGA
jgi:hypothetical protein